MKKLLAASLSFLLFISCSTLGRITPKARDQKVIHLSVHDCREVLAEGYRQTGLQPPEKEPGYVDGIYIFPNDDLLNAMDRYVPPKQHRQWVAESWDCDDAAKEWCVLTHLWWVEVTKGKVPIALATFVVYVEIEAGAFDGRMDFSGGHALGLLCDSDSIWWYVEPRAHWHVRAEEALLEGNIVAKQIIW